MSSVEPQASRPKQVATLLPRPLIERFDEVAKRNDRSRASEFRQAIRRHIEAQEKA